MKEKEGAAVFVRCPNCDGWFTVTEPLLDLGNVALYCPGCTHRFLPEDAAEIDRP